MLDFPRDNSHNPFPSDSKLYFRVAERPLGWFNERTDEHVRIDKQKAIVREYAGGGRWLANVGENYKLLTNEEFFNHCQDRMLDVIKPEFLQRVDVRDSMSYNGRDCYREYHFLDLLVPNKPVHFKLTIGNSYGSKACTFMYGAEDEFCSNGMIFGTAEKHARKHTSGLTLAGFDTWIDNAFAMFDANAKRIERYDNCHIDLTKEDGLFEHLVDKGLLSAQRAREAQNDMHTERNKRDGRDTRPTLWHLYSALTDWASHSDVRDTGNDHEANTRIQRTQHAERVIRAADAFVGA